MGKEKGKIIFVKEQPEELEKETKRRKKGMEEEFSKDVIVRLFPNDEGYDQMIAQTNIPFTALCEHHEVSFEGEASIAYIPGEWLVGLSKIARITEHYLNPTVKTIQERATQQILEVLKKVEPKGVMVILKAKHNCLCHRGVKRPSLTITSAVYGEFAKGLNAREEFLKLISL